MGLNVPSYLLRPPRYEHGDDGCVSLKCLIKGGVPEEGAMRTACPELSRTRKKLYGPSSGGAPATEGGSGQASGMLSALEKLRWTSEGELRRRVKSDDGAPTLFELGRGCPYSKRRTT